MNIKEKAKLFAITAHKNQIRKNEPDKPYIIHPISVGMILEKYVYDESVIAAGYLHDIIEDTKYTEDDIKKEFGNEIASLVMDASEPDKSLPWKDRKKHTIENTKNLSLKSKVIICADKINNLEDLMIKFQKEGKRDFSAFNKGEEDQKWYYTNIYKSLIYNEDKNLPIFKRLKNVLDIVFNKEEDTFLKNIIFDVNKNYYEKLKKIHASKLELQKLKELTPLSKPFVIEFSGTPRTGKTTIINNLYDFFKKGDFKVTVIEEFTTSNYYKEVFMKKHKNNTSVEINIKILEEVTEQLKEAINDNNEIIIIDRSINDRQIWNYRNYQKGGLNLKLYNELKEKYSKISKELINVLVITYADPLTSLKRDYNSSLALENRRFLNINNIEEYNNSLDVLKELFELSVDNFILLDTSHTNINDTAINIASQIISNMREEYIKNIKQKYN